jgi:putative effector of murein hydrolase LrgA (UPF0299 family)
MEDGMANLIENLIDILYVGGILGFFLLVLALAAMCHKLDNRHDNKLESK